MKKKMLTVLSTLLIGCSLFTVPASAGVWIPHQGNVEYCYKFGDWEYVYDDGSHASGWNYIDGNWYYFDEDNITYCGNYTWDNSIGSYVGNNSITIDGQIYYFDKDCHMLHDCYIIIGNSGYQFWIDSNGHLISDKIYGSLKSGYDLSQVK